MSARPTPRPTSDVHIGNAIAVTADVTRDMKNEWSGKKYTNGVVEAKYALSKRTFVYLAGLRLDKTNNYGLGIRHNF